MLDRLVEELAVPDCIVELIPEVVGLVFSALGLLEVLGEHEMQLGCLLLLKEELNPAGRPFARRLAVIRHSHGAYLSYIILSKL